MLHFTNIRFPILNTDFRKSVPPLVAKVAVILVVLWLVSFPSLANNELIADSWTR